MRTAFIRVTATNTIKDDSEELGLKAGEVIEYSLADILHILDEWKKTKKGLTYFVIEHDDEGNRHYHIVIEFHKKSSCRFMTLKKKFPVGRIETCRTGVKNCVQYLVHMNNPEKKQYEWDKVITNSPAKLEKYKIPSKASIDVETQLIIEKILTGEIRRFEIDKIDPEIYIRNRSSIKNAFEYRDELLAKIPNRKIGVVVLQGSSQIGKTTFCKAFAEKHNKSICFSSSSHDPWQDYGGQDIFVYDDFDFTAIKIDDFKKALDTHTSTSMARRYKNILFQGDTIFIATNTRITDWFPFSKSIDRKAIFKRIKYVYVFKDRDPNEGIVHYTINTLVETSDWDHAVDRDGNIVNEFYRWELKPIENPERTFDLAKYIGVTDDNAEEDAFLEQLEI